MHPAKAYLVFPLAHIFEVTSSQEKFARAFVLRRHGFNANATPGKNTAIEQDDWP